MAYADFAEIAGLSKGYWNPKENWGVTTHFLEIIKEQLLF